MEPSTAQINQAIEAMAEVIPHFPATPTGRRFVAIAIRQFVGDQSQLEWLTTRAAEAMGDRWQGLKELRGLFCTVFRPADGIEADCTLPGSTAADLEAKYIRKSADENEQRLIGYRQRKQIAPPGAVFDAPPLPAVQSMPGMAPKRSPRLRWAAVVNLEAELAAAPKTWRNPEETERLLGELERELEISAGRRHAGPSTEPAA